MPNRQQIKDLEVILQERKEMILSYLDGVKKNISQLKDQEMKDDVDYAELSSDSFNENMLANHQFKELTQIEDALDRISKKTYGICEMCECVIPIKRLRAKPFARYCTECRQAYEDEQIRKSS